MLEGQELQPVPDTLLEKASTVTFQEKRINVAGIDVFYQEPVVEGDAKTVSLLMLHGMAFKSQTWRDLGTLAMIGAMGHKAVAVDLPGYGETPSGSVPHKGQFVSSMIQELGLDRPVIVSPSMSGSFTLPFLLNDPSTATERSRGYIPVAPVGTAAFTKEQYGKCQVPTMIVCGSRDQNIGSASTKDLVQLPKKDKFILDNAGHACYMDQPAKWHQLIYNFITTLEKSV